MEVQYVPQVCAIGSKAFENQIDLQEVNSCYNTRLRAAQQAFSHPLIPPIYHQYIAERETWKNYFEDEFPGKDPLYDCLVAALNHIEREPEQHMTTETEANQSSHIDHLNGRIHQLESLVLQKDFVIKSKDELLKIRSEGLVANRELMSEKDRIIQDMELQQAQTLIKSSETTSQTNKEIQNPKDTISQKDDNIQKLREKISRQGNTLRDGHNIIVKRNKTIEDLKKEVSDLKKASNQNNEPLGITKHQRSLEQQENLSKDDEIRTLENQLAHRDHIIRTLEFAYKNLEKNLEMRITKLLDEVKTKDQELGELRSHFEEDQMGWKPETQYEPASSKSGKIKKKKQLKIKPEPMEY